MCPRGARLLAGEGGLLEPTRLVCHCLLIEGAEGLVLIDTGFGSGDVARRRQLGTMFNALVRPELRAEETAAAQLRARGFDPGDVRHIVTTHLDLDHSGGLPDFPDAEVHLLGDELRAALNPGLRERQRYIAAHWAHGPRWVEHEGGGEDWFGFAGVRVLPGSGAEILLIPLTGHTLGHTGVAVRNGAGWLLHCGDAYFRQSEVQTPAALPAGTRAVRDAQPDRRQAAARERRAPARAGEPVTAARSSWSARTTPPRWTPRPPEPRPQASGAAETCAAARPLVAQLRHASARPWSPGEFVSKVISRMAAEGGVEAPVAPLWGELRYGGELARLLAATALAGKPLLGSRHEDAQPVMLIPGFMAGDSSLTISAQRVAGSTGAFRAGLAGTDVDYYSSVHQHGDFRLGREGVRSGLSSACRCD